MTSQEALELATRYAPIFAQKVSDKWKVADQIVPVDFAGSIEEVSKNPQKFGELADDTEIPAKIYYSVCETTTHYFLIYAAYHVLDWWKRFEPDNLYDFLRDLVDEHVHDMEGALLVVTKAPGDRRQGNQKAGRELFPKNRHPIRVCHEQKNS